MERRIPPDKSDRRWPGERTTADAARDAAGRRGRAQRRLVYDRRELIRFENDRRMGKERRLGVDPWAIP